MSKLPKKDLLKESDAGMGIAHCGVCGERFHGEDRAEVVLTANLKKRGMKKGRVMIIHADTCFDSRYMEIA